MHVLDDGGCVDPVNYYVPSVWFADLELCKLW
jgi:hypothetical protein